MLQDRLDQQNEQERHVSLCRRHNLSQLWIRGQYGAYARLFLKVSSLDEVSSTYLLLINMKT